MSFRECRNAIPAAVCCCSAPAHCLCNFQSFRCYLTSAKRFIVLPSRSLSLSLSGSIVQSLCVPEIRKKREHSAAASFAFWRRVLSWKWKVSRRFRKGKRSRVVSVGRKKNPQSGKSSMCDERKVLNVPQQIDFDRFERCTKGRLADFAAKRRKKAGKRPEVWIESSIVALGLTVWSLIRLLSWEGFGFKLSCKTCEAVKHNLWVATHEKMSNWIFYGGWAGNLKRKFLRLRGIERWRWISSSSSSWLVQFYRKNLASAWKH